jgi:hypothetical protein
MKLGWVAVASLIMAVGAVPTSAGTLDGTWTSNKGNKRTIRGGSAEYKGVLPDGGGFGAIQQKVVPLGGNQYKIGKMTCHHYGDKMNCRKGAKVREWTRD